MNMQKIAVALLALAAAAPAGAVGRLADVTVYDRTEGRTLPVYRHGGRYYVVGKPGNEYQVGLRNRGGGDVLAVMSVDGVNAISGETANWSQTGYVLGAGQEYEIRGWRKSLDRIAAFYFTEHRNSYAARTGRPDNVGVIGVALFRKRAQPEPLLEQPPAPWSGRRDESAWPAEDAAAGALGSADAARAEESAGAARSSRPAPARRGPSLGTGHGRVETSHSSYTSFERATASPAEIVAIHYDTHANLVAMGVIRAPRLAVPSPFPGQFVPDPR